MRSEPGILLIAEAPPVGADVDALRSGFSEVTAGGYPGFGPLGLTLLLDVFASRLPGSGAIDVLFDEGKTFCASL